MTILGNENFRMELSDRGALQSLILQGDPSEMNWVVDPSYLEEAGYADTDKLFGEWTIELDGNIIKSTDLLPNITLEGKHRVIVDFEGAPIAIRLTYSLEDERLRWTIEAMNRSTQSVRINGLHVWFSLAYVMYRDENVQRNMSQSCAVFPHLGGDFAKIAAIRRSNEAPHLGVYGVQGRTVTVGTYCSYKNRFLEQVSPSLDGLLYHRLSLVEDGSSMTESAAADWIYGGAYSPLDLDAGETSSWEYIFHPCQNRDDFYRQGMAYGHPRWSYTPVLTRGGRFEAVVDLPQGQALRELRLYSTSTATELIRQENITNEAVRLESGSSYTISLQRLEPGEHKLELGLEDGRTDILVWNVLESIDLILEKRAEWLVNNNFGGTGEAERPYAFRPLSNQGESLGKVAFLLMKNSMAKAVPEQVAKAEIAAVLDVKEHWFEGGDFNHPRPLYGEFYRIYDLDYIGHVFYLLSRMDGSLLKIHSPREYLQWAAEIMCLRLDPDRHSGQREQDESRLNGIFVLYILDLLEALKQSGLSEEYKRLLTLWEQFGRNLETGIQQYEGAITEHFYDNAGFGPTCETLCHLGNKEEAQRYGQLILANIGFSNDYRVQNPDRWWEALSYMIHSLWGGLVAGASRVAYEFLGDPEYLEAAYRSTMAVFNCYDWNVRSTPRRLLPGEAASTYSVAAPNLNMPELSRNRFGQSVFVGASDSLFASLFSGVTGDDWDMGEELVAYLMGFGTTTYLYRDPRGKMRCINGYIEEDSEGWIVTSYAAYPSRYVLLEDKLEYRTTEGILEPRVRLAGGGIFSPCL
ncbi:MULTISPECIES: hypothetical protein [Paenibacillus]|uniref:hypothetical protein n=1 Tax=Paenibacillus TaxID=44249 RepID=UPI00096E4D23|nr:hypothetical protein [Paenibacillus odorifer]OMD79431.1 hypothetical protein BSK53_22375 [Paenibacillus odorifer]OMD95984.1 hypothetical protein BSK67_07075 [Paenibacillus odorifer]